MYQLPQNVLVRTVAAHSKQHCPSTKCFLITAIAVSAFASILLAISLSVGLPALTYSKITALTFTAIISTSCSILGILALVVCLILLWFATLHPERFGPQWGKYKHLAITVSLCVIVVLLMFSVVAAICSVIAAIKHSFSGIALALLSSGATIMCLVVLALLIRASLYFVKQQADQIPKDLEIGLPMIEEQPQSLNSEAESDQSVNLNSEAESDQSVNLNSEAESDQSVNLQTDSY